MTVLAPDRPRWVTHDLAGATGRGVSIAVIDSGWDYTLPNPQVVQGIGLIDDTKPFKMTPSRDAQDRIGHGTACSDLILQIAPQATILPIRVFAQTLETSIQILQTAIHWATKQGIRVINLSLGTTLVEAQRPLAAVCEAAAQAGTVVVAAASDHEAMPSYPSVLDNVIGVAGAGFTDPFKFSYRPGQTIQCLAKGGEQPVTWLGGHPIRTSGTSFSAPYIAGIIALFLEHQPHARLPDIHTLLATHAVKVEEGDTSAFS